MPCLESQEAAKRHRDRKAMIARSGQGVQTSFTKLAVWSLLGCLLAACSSTAQLYGAQVIAAPTAASLKSDDLTSFGIAFVTPSTVTGQEEDKAALALAFSQTLEQQRPKVHVVPLTETLT